MKKLSLRRLAPATAAAVAFTHAATSRADPPTPTTTTTAQPATTQPAPAASPVQTSTTATTAAPYTASARSDSTERTTERRPNRTLLSTGIGLFVASYGASVVAGAVSDRAADQKLFIPVVGPWLDLGERGCDERECGSREDVYEAMIITSGIAQGAAVLLGIGSLVIPETTTTERAAAKPEVKVSPVSFGAGAGLGAVGRF
jgi:hypothetical protein